MSGTTSPIAIHGIVPAAGVSRRMGRPKQTLAYGSSTVTGTVAETMMAGGVNTVTIITRSKLIDRLKLPQDPRIAVLTNDDPHSEMIDSVRLALRHLECQGHIEYGGDRSSGILIVPGDMPNVSAADYAQSIAAFRSDTSRMVIVTHAGRRGHPLIFPSELTRAVYDMQDGLNGLPRRFPQLVVTVEVSAGGVIADIDTPADYNVLRRQGRTPSDG